MQKLKSLSRRFRAFLRSKPETLMSLIRASRPPKLPGLERLYVVEVIAPMDVEREKEFDAQLARISDKYGLDFLLTDPGVRIKRFNDIV